MRSKVTQGGGASVVYALPKETLVDAFGQKGRSVLFPFGMAVGPRGLPSQTHQPSVYMVVASSNRSP
ncbi:hypothetical protein [Actinomadura montaniterrae]|uniref:Uncharacterized protein n=1 Tax=Actinomadura montaniterrae TaxID=1803903 RepID=A0A6L3W730_9ACTN|nr:hypothetical protein [Actinomadura montaniterrae]KAB2388832.1 hypothetical protein F9B16_02645 [Actinomadura montaniterrae]